MRLNLDKKHSQQFNGKQKISLKKILLLSVLTYIFLHVQLKALNFLTSFIFSQVMVNISNVEFLFQFSFSCLVEPFFINPIGSIACNTKKSNFFLLHGIGYQQLVVKHVNHHLSGLHLHLHPQQIVSLFPHNYTSVCLYPRTYNITGDTRGMK